MPEPASAARDTAERLRERGERLTPQRLLVLDILRDAPGHLSAGTVLALALARYPYLNQATVYRTLTWLRDQGLATAVDLGNGHTEYEYCRAGEHHHHLVCERCRQTIELDDALVAPLAEAIRARLGFVPRLDHLAVFGLCRTCQASVTAGGGSG
jgi:Fur family ferric uptake transcriptional regulator